MDFKHLEKSTIYVKGIQTPEIKLFYKYGVLLNRRQILTQKSFLTCIQADYEVILSFTSVIVFNEKHFCLDCL